MNGFKGKKIIKQDNGKVIVVNKKQKDDNPLVPSEWSISDKKLNSQDINMINKRLGKKNKRKFKK